MCRLLGTEVILRQKKSGGKKRGHSITPRHFARRPTPRLKKFVKFFLEVRECLRGLLLKRYRLVLKRYRLENEPCI